jgi:hypothetical protein
LTRTVDFSGRLPQFVHGERTSQSRVQERARRTEEREDRVENSASGSHRDAGRAQLDVGSRRGTSPGKCETAAEVRRKKRGKQSRGGFLRFGFSDVVRDEPLVGFGQEGVDGSRVAAPHPVSLAVDAFAGR